jgi:regulatory protein
VGEDSLLSKAIATLGRKERTIAEMAAWLDTRGAPADEVEATLTDLIEAGVLDDERYACRYAEDKRELAGWGDDRIASVLRDRGVGGDLIDAALAADDGGELARAVAWLERQGEAPADDEGRGRCFASLARRGYSAELAYEAVRRFERGE